MSSVLDTHELDEIVAILEAMEDEEMAASYLRELSERTKRLGHLLMNRDQHLTHDEWKKMCDEAKRSVDDLLEKIRKL